MSDTRPIWDGVVLITNSNKSKQNIPTLSTRCICFSLKINLLLSYYRFGIIKQIVNYLVSLEVNVFNDMQNERYDNNSFIFEETILVINTYIKQVYYKSM